MQIELPWNIAGISAEAREAARAAARREGLSVGEWLSRQIVACPEPGMENPDLAGWKLAKELPAGLAANEERPAAQDTLDMTGRMVRTEGESPNGHSKIGEQMNAIAHRLETAERNQAESSRAMSQTAAQTSIAVRQQAQALEQMNVNIDSLGERLVRLERQTTQDGMKEAAKALHQGLSHVAGQITETATRSASQMAALAGNIDSLSTRLAQTHDRADATARAIDLSLASVDERIRVVERMAFSSASALDHTMENMERLRAAQEEAQPEAQTQATAMARMKDACDGLNARISACEGELAAAMVRLDEALSRLQSQEADDPLDRRLEGIERVLSDLLARTDRTERSTANRNSGVEHTLRELSAGFEVAEKRNRETAERLQSAVQDADNKIAGIEDKLSALQAENQAEPILDMLPFSDEQRLADPVVERPPPPFPLEEPLPPDRSATGFEDTLGDMGSPKIEPADSFLAAARRAARDESEASPHAAMGGFAWTFTGKGENGRPKEGSKRYLMAGSIFGVAVAAALTGMVLTRGAGSPPAHLSPVSAGVSPLSSSREIVPAKTAAGTRPFATDAAFGAASTPRPKLPAPSHTAARQPTQNDGTALPPVNGPASANTASQSAGPAAVASTQRPSTALQSGLQRIAALANSGDSKGQLLLGLKYLGGGVPANEAEAARWLARAAQQGEPLAQYRLGTLYERGRGVPADAKQATHWYELAAKQGNRKAMHNLAVAFAEGAGEAKDPKQAALWFTRAANLGLADSQFNLAVLYERGMGVPQSLVDAYRWYLIAAAQGDAESKKRSDALATQLSDRDRNAAQQTAATFRPQAPNPAANTPPAFG